MFACGRDDPKPEFRLGFSYPALANMECGIQGITFRGSRLGHVMECSDDPVIMRRFAPAVQSCRH